jgi:predicted nucleotidyltransferase
MEIDKNIAQRAISELKGLFGERLKQIILYGSYARGDFDGESDVDIMVLADMGREETVNYRQQVRNISHDIGLDNNIYVSIKLNSAGFFFEKLSMSGFYKNIVNEGVVLYDK